MIGVVKTKRWILSDILWRFSLLRLTGPLLDKELRVASRRKRTYLYRFVYIIGLLLIMLPYWSDAFYVGDTPSAYRQARMAEGVIYITLQVMWFQFFALPSSAVLLLSGAFSEEISKRTLGVLMTTPISPFKIVIGKLFSTMYQLFVLILLSVPVFSILSLFGGLEWRYIAVAIIVILGLSLSVGLITVYYSTLFKNGFAVIVISILTVLFLYWFLPLFFSDATSFYLFHLQFKFKEYFDPVSLFVSVHDTFLNCTGGLGVVLFVSMKEALCVGLLVPGFQLLIVPLFLWLTVRRIRKKGFRVLHEQSKFVRWFTDPPQEAQQPVGGKAIELKPLRTVTGRAMIWKELRTPVLRRRKFKLAAIVFPFILLNVFVFTIFGLLQYRGILEILVGLLFFVTGIVPFLTTLFFAAGTIPAEKERGAWSILMGTPLSEWDILVGKMVGIFKNTAVIWFSISGFILIILHIAGKSWLDMLGILFIESVYFLLILSTGLFFGSFLRKQMVSILLSMIFLIGLFVGDSVLFLRERYFWFPGDYYEFLFYPRYLIQILDNQEIDKLYMLTSLGIYLIIAIVLFLLTKGLLRRKIF